MRFEPFPFGLIRIDGLTYEHDVVVDRGEVRKRKKNQRRRDPGHSPHAVFSSPRSAVLCASPHSFGSPQSPAFSSIEFALGPASATTAGGGLQVDVSKARQSTTLSSSFFC